MGEQANDPTGKKADQMLSTMLSECPGLGEVVEQFVRSLPSRVTAMEEALREGSIDQLRAQAGRLKSTGRDHGFETLSRQAGEIERAAHDGLIDQLAVRIAEVSALIQKVKVDLEERSH